MLQKERQLSLSVEQHISSVFYLRPKFSDNEKAATSSNGVQVTDVEEATRRGRCLKNFGLIRPRQSQLCDEMILTFFSATSLRPPHSL